MCAAFELLVMTDAIRHLIEDGSVQENTPETHQWVSDYLAYGAELNEVPKDKIPGAVATAVEKTGLGDVRALRSGALHDRPAELDELLEGLQPGKEGDVGGGEFDSGI